MTSNIFTTKPRRDDLAELVQSIWCYQSNTEHNFEQVLPGVISQLLINLHENELRYWVEPGQRLKTIGPVGIQGLLTEPVLIDTLQKRNLCGVAFISYGLSAFCDVSASHFTDTIVDATELWGASATNLRAALCKESDQVNRCQIIEAFLAERLTRDHSENELIKEILTLMGSGFSIANARKRVGLSQRGLHALFEKRVGVRPKTFERVDRFGSVLKSMPSKEALSVLAFNNGFADQPHFTREFRVFAGKAPTQHRSITNENRHVQFPADKIFKTSRRD